MKYRIVKETKPTLSTFGRYKATACHCHTVDTDQLIEELTRQGMSAGTVIAVLKNLSKAVGRHLRQGDRVRLDDWGLMKLEIESETVDTPDVFNARKHIRSVRLHFIPQSSGGSPMLYKDLTYERDA